MIPTHYTHEQKLRKAWAIKYGSPEGYHKATDEQKESVLNEIDNY